MHTVSPSNETNYKIVECQNPFCSICTLAVDENGTPPSPLTEGIAVYTCSNPSCSLCDGDYSLLLDIVNPSLAPTEDCFLQQYVKNACNSNTFRDDTQPKDISTRINKRKLSGHHGYPTKSRRYSTGSSKLGSDEVDSVDEIQLMNLEVEFELDKMQWLPDLQTDVTDLS